MKTGTRLISGWMGALALFIAGAAGGQDRKGAVDAALTAPNAAAVTRAGTRVGSRVRSAETPRWVDEAIGTRPRYFDRGFPFSFILDGIPSASFLQTWKREDRLSRDREGRSESRTVLSSSRNGLKVTCELATFDDFPAAEWVLYFENVATTDTPMVEDVRVLDLRLASPMRPDRPFVLHRTNGAPSNPSDFEMAAVTVKGDDVQTLSAGGGRSSNRDFPFFRIDTGRGAAIIAIGWSGQWQAEVRCVGGERLLVRAGMERTRFKLHPGERVRMPRILLLLWDGPHEASNSQFRRLIYNHYAARFRGKKPLPVLFCNTCFTRGGGWLNECNEANQVSLIRALQPLGVEAVITDAGWFKGGWPNGAGNWEPDPAKYPRGMAPVAAAARDCGMIYGLWFEPERVVPGTRIDREHPDWILRRKTGGHPGLLNFGLPDVQNHFFNIVARFMRLPGFAVYRQDFNMDPLGTWIDNDVPGRRRITEMRYIEGLYAYWDKLAETFPDSLREECASGGRRIDLETLMRFHIHQKTDYWFDNEVDQASLFSLSQYLPNNLIAGHVNRLDTYSFHSSLASSLCLGWIADAPDFDHATAKRLTDQYRAVRHLLIGDWYPLTPYSRRPDEWLGSQYHRADLGEGMLLVFRRKQAPQASIQVRLKGLDPAAVYTLESQHSELQRELAGRRLMDGLDIPIPQAPGSALIVYRRK